MQFISITDISTLLRYSFVRFLGWICRSYYSFNCCQFLFLKLRLGRCFLIDNETKTNDFARKLILLSLPFWIVCLNWRIIFSVRPVSVSTRSTWPRCWSTPLAPTWTPRTPTSWRSSKKFQSVLCLYARQSGTISLLNTCIILYDFVIVK